MRKRISADELGEVRAFAMQWGLMANEIKRHPQNRGFTFTAMREGKKCHYWLNDGNLEFMAEECTADGK